MNTAISLRWYQKAAVDAIFSYFKKGNTGHPLVVAPTGSGKTHILAGFVAEVHKRYPAEHILIITHVKEIIEQDYNTLIQYIPSDLLGIYSSGLARRDVCQFTVASIQSVYKHAELFQNVKLVVVDEAHLIPATGTGRYQTFLAAMPQAKVVGITATPFRLGTGMLTDEPHLFDKIIYSVDIQKLINDGYLATVRCKATTCALDVSNVPIVAGDYNKQRLSQEVDRETITNRIVDDLVKYKDQRKSWLIFAIDIQHCEHIAQALTKRGITAAAVHSKLDIDRKILLSMFKSRHFQALVSVETLTTGFDAPNVDLIALLRPTQSPVLHVQMIGRGMRVYPDKLDCLVLDYAGNVSALGPIDAVAVQPTKKKSKGNATAFMRVCPDCKELVHASRKACPDCGFVFPIKTRLDTLPDNDAAVLSFQKPTPKVVQVKTITYTKYQKMGSLPTLKVTYYAGGIQFYHKWLAFEHQGLARRSAERWWKNLADTAPPATVDEALARKQELAKVRAIHVLKINRYYEIVHYETDDNDAATR